MDDTEESPPATIFKGIPNKDIEKPCSHGRDLSLEAGHRLFERGQEAQELMILRDGVVHLIFPVRIMGVSRDLTAEVKRTGDVLAWSALVDPCRLTLGACCASKCVVTSWHRDMLRDYFGACPDVGYVFMQNLAGVIGRRLQTIQHMWLRELQAGATKRLE